MARVLVVIDRSCWGAGIEALASEGEPADEERRRELLAFLFRLDAIVRRLVEEEPAPECRLSAPRLR